MGEVYTPEEACSIAGGTVTNGRCEVGVFTKLFFAKLSPLRSYSMPKRPKRGIFGGSWDAGSKQCTCDSDASMCNYIGGIKNSESCTINPYIVKPAICTGAIVSNYADGQCYLPGQLSLVGRGVELLIEDGEDLLIGRSENEGGGGHEYRPGQQALWGSTRADKAQIAEAFWQMLVRSLFVEGNFIVRNYVDISHGRRRA